MKTTFYIGWDVGAWSCTADSKSCDALVILDENGNQAGKSFRGNKIKSILNEAADTEQFLNLFFHCCEVPNQDQQVVLAIDAPLGYSESFVKLITEYSPSNKKFEEYRDNSYLFRKTENHIFNSEIQNKNNKVVRPLSAVNDMIGSQSTKGIHVIAKYAPNIEITGVWVSHDRRLTIIETYPSVNREIEIPENLKEANADVIDAYICAKIAYEFKCRNEKLVKPCNEIPEKEGWIWYLKK